MLSVSAVPVLPASLRFGRVAEPVSVPLMVNSPSCWAILMPLPAVSFRVSPGLTSFSLLPLTWPLPVLAEVAIKPELLMAAARSPALTSLPASAAAGAVMEPLLPTTREVVAAPTLYGLAVEPSPLTVMGLPERASTLLDAPVALMVISLPLWLMLTLSPALNSRVSPLATSEPAVAVPPLDGVLATLNVCMAVSAFFRLPFAASVRSSS